MTEVIMVVITILSGGDSMRADPVSVAQTVTQVPVAVCSSFSDKVQEGWKPEVNDGQSVEVSVVCIPAE